MTDGLVAVSPADAPRGLPSGAMTPHPDDAVRAVTTVRAAPAEAFARFTDGLADWWPADYTWSQAVLETIAIEPGEGGMCFERGPHGFRIDWGRVLAWEPPHRLVFTWQIGPHRDPVPDPAAASEVEVGFSAAEGGTRVTLEHRGFARHGEEGEAYREAMGSEAGWPLILDRFAASG